MTTATSANSAAAKDVERFVPLRAVSFDSRSITRKRIMIIDPPFKRLYHDSASLVKFPLALGYLSGAVLKWTDWDVQAYNADFNPRKQSITIDNVTRISEGMARYIATLEDPTAAIWAEIRTAITEFDPGVVGISSKTQNFPSAMRIARIAKEHNPDTLVVLGGPHATLSTTAALDCPDYRRGRVGRRRDDAGRTAQGAGERHAAKRGGRVGLSSGRSRVLHADARQHGRP